jgi:hypothetical protein
VLSIGSSLFFLAGKKGANKGKAPECQHKDVLDPVMQEEKIDDEISLLASGLTLDVKLRSRGIQ